MGVPWDVKLAIGSIGVYLLSLVLTVFNNMLDGMFLFAFIAIPMMVGATVVLAGRLVFLKPTILRKASLGLVVVCLITCCAGSQVASRDMHIARRIELSGGQKSLRSWAQGIMDQCQPDQPVRALQLNEVPTGIQTYLSGHVSAGHDSIAIHLGGGFFHYGVIVRRPLAGNPSQIAYYYE